MATDRIFDNKPAEDFLNAYPLGNGSMGAMIFGTYPEERILLNHEHCWSGPPPAEDNFDRTADLEKARNLIRGREYKKAQDLIESKLQGEFGEAYMPAGWLTISVSGVKTGGCTRSLDLGKALAAVDSGSGIHAEHFISNPYNLFCSLLKFEKPVTLKPGLEITNTELFRQYSERRLTVAAQCPDHTDPDYKESDRPYVYSGSGIIYSICLEIKHYAGNIEGTADGLQIINCTRAELRLAIVTGYNGYKKKAESSTEKIMQNCAEVIRKCSTFSYDQIKTGHTEDFSSLYSAVNLSLLNTDRDTSDVPVSERILRFREDPSSDPGFIELYFNYGRYLLISSSRYGNEPANLQGIWNADIRPAWCSNWTLNINLQMNYWAAGSCGLNECLDPFIKLVTDLAESGKETAYNFFGCSGWTCCHNSDLWRKTAPVEGSASWAYWPFGSAWLSVQMYRSWEYLNDPELLAKTVFPVIQESVRFYNDWLQADENGIYQTIPSTSPENLFLDDDGNECAVAVSSAMDLTLLKILTGIYLEISENIACSVSADRKLAEDIRHKLEKLQPFRCSASGRLLEWNEDFREQDPGHRHMSPLFGIYPETLLFDESAEIIEGARRRFLNRLENSEQTGWNAAWTSALASRFGMKEITAEKLFLLIGNSSCNNLMSSHNLLDKNPDAAVFQIDGNFGGTAAILELLVHDFGSKLHLLPALPHEMHSGSLSGYRTRSGLVIDMEWKEGVITRCTFRAFRDVSCRVEFYTGNLQENGDRLRKDGDGYVLMLSAGETHATTLTQRRND